MVENATFMAFKPSGKWAYEGRGFLSPEVFKVFSRVERRDRILLDNGGKFPGMISRADDLIWVVIGDPELSYEVPLLLYPEGMSISTDGAI